MRGPAKNTRSTSKLTVAGNPSGPAHPPKVTGVETKDVSIKAGLSGPAHPPKTAGEQILSCVIPSEAISIRSKPSQ